MKYDIVIILCPEKKDPNGDFPQYKDGEYLGGQTRMDAAKELYYKNNKVTNFVVVGGYDEDGSECSRKTHDMKCFLTNHCRGIKIEEIKSLPCTKHNLVAIFNTLGNKLKGKKIGLLTNFYHLPRALRFWRELINEEFGRIPMPFPISAESITASLSMYINHNEYLLRLEKERLGLRDLEDNYNQYQCNCLFKNFGKFKGIIKNNKNSKILLTKKEQNRTEIKQLLKNKKKNR